MKVLSIATISAIAAMNPDGFTVSAFTGVTPQAGYAVALKETQNSFGAEGLERVINIIASGQTGATCVGGWLDNETGLYYYDAVAIFQDRAAAIEFGRMNEQIAIFDLLNLKEIRL